MSGFGGQPKVCALPGFNSVPAHPDKPAWWKMQGATRFRNTHTHPNVQRNSESEVEIKGGFIANTCWGWLLVVDSQVSKPEFRDPVSETNVGIHVASGKTSQTEPSPVPKSGRRGRAAGASGVTDERRQRCAQRFPKDKQEYP